MRDCVVVDAPLIGWARESEQRIKGDYAEIIPVPDAPGLSASSSDSAVASFCIKNGCDLLTSDKKAYTPMLDEHGAREVHISLYDSNAPQHVYLMRAT